MEPMSEAVFEILLALADGPRHGYGIIQEVESRTEGRVRLGPGTVYGAVKRLLEQGWIEEREDDTCSDVRRRYYALTAHGRQAASREARRLSALVQAARGKRLLPVAGG